MPLLENWKSLKAADLNIAFECGMRRCQSLQTGISHVQNVCSLSSEAGRQHDVILVVALVIAAALLTGASKP